MVGWEPNLSQEGQIQAGTTASCSAGTGYTGPTLIFNFFPKGLETWPFPFFLPQSAMLQVFYSLLPKEMKHFTHECYSICPSALPRNVCTPGFTSLRGRETKKKRQIYGKFEAGAAGGSERDALG